MGGVVVDDKVTVVDAVVHVASAVGWQIAVVMAAAMTWQVAVVARIGGGGLGSVDDFPVCNIICCGFW